jgi:hypothetical protein
MLLKVFEIKRHLKSKKVKGKGQRLEARGLRLETWNLRLEA